MEAKEVDPWEKVFNRDLRRDESRSTNAFFPEGTCRKRSRRCKASGEKHALHV